ncbi:MAG TPA: type II toxin-antitoxin system VapC family toxin [Pseudonocardia sp.]|uniref:type II toxin-antitoxin system VapC family toxin n=1 Tax=Pseudonocardia sp. TaxID=60912 RepID=UPI002F3E572F
MSRRALLDTSVLIGAESGRPMDLPRIPGDGLLSVVSLAELHAGVLAADDIDIRAQRLTTLNGVNDIELIGIDEPTALMWARMRVHLARSGRRLNVNDLWIAASAASRGLPVMTQDNDFAALEGVGGLQVIRV